MIFCQIDLLYPISGGPSIRRIGFFPKKPWFSQKIHRFPQSGHCFDLQHTAAAESPGLAEDAPDIQFSGSERKVVSGAV